MAELTFALLLSLARNVALADRLLREGHWPKPKLGGPLLRGKTLGIVGAGNIGGLVGEMGAAWGMRVLGCVARPSEASRTPWRAAASTLTDFDEVVERADFLTLHVPLDERHAPHGRRIRAGQDAAGFTSGQRGPRRRRGREGALRRAHRRRHRAGAALDVHEVEGEGTVSPLAGLPNVVLTPHIGAMALDSQRLIGERVLELVEAFHEGNLDGEVQDGEDVL